MAWRNLKAKNEGQYLSLEIIKITQEDLHDFNADFTTRYSKWLSQGYDMREQYNRELEGLINGYSVFQLYREYTNSYGVKMVIEEIGECVIITLDGERLEAVMWRDLENGTEVICCRDCIWWASDLEDNENEIYDRGTEEKETF